MEQSQFSFMVDSLKEFNYPHIQSMDESEILDIFSAANRQFLVSWILERLGHHTKDEDIAEVICSYGFCSPSGKNDFLSGICGNSLQLMILYRMCNFMKSASKSEETVPLQLEDIDKLVNLDTNLFPSLGLKQTLSPEERKKQAEHVLQETEEIERYLATIKGASTPNLGVKSELVGSMKNFEDRLPEFKHQVLDFMNNYNCEETDGGVFGEGFEEALAALNRNIKTVLEYLQSASVVTNFQDNTAKARVDPNRNLLMIRRIADLCQEITTLKKPY